jgi:hypothetical protein
VAYQGLIEVHHSKSLSGWCFNEGNRTEPCRLGIYCDDQLLRTVLADAPRDDIMRGHKAYKSGFSLPITPSLSSLLPANTILKVKAPDGTELPLYKPEKIELVGTTDDEGSMLRAKLSAGYFVDKWGSVKLSFKGMPAAHRALYAQGMVDLTEYFSERFGITLFPHYGTLLGYARAKSFLPHDDDTDMSFVIHASYIEEVAETFLRLADEIIADGHFVGITATGQMHVRMKDKKHIGSDIFASWLSARGDFRTYFGVGGKLAKPDITFFRDRIEGVELNIPRNYEELLSFAYGPNWQTPDPSFQWVIPPSIRDQMDALKTLGRGRVGEYNASVLAKK